VGIIDMANGGGIGMAGRVWRGAVVWDRTEPLFSALYVGSYQTLRTHALTLLRRN
jgi:hypothetical protein